MRTKWQVWKMTLENGDTTLFLAQGRVFPGGELDRVYGREKKAYSFPNPVESVQYVGEAD